MLICLQTEFLLSVNSEITKTKNTSKTLNHPHNFIQYTIIWPQKHVKMEKIIFTNSYMPWVFNVNLIFLHTWKASISKRIFWSKWMDIMETRLTVRMRQGYVFFKTKCSKKLSQGEWNYTPILITLVCFKVIKLVLHSVFLSNLLSWDNTLKPFPFKSAKPPCQLPDDTCVKLLDLGTVTNTCWGEWWKKGALKMFDLRTGEAWKKDHKFSSENWV